MFRRFLLAILLPAVMATSAAAAEKISVACNPTWPPMELLDDNKQIVGFDVDMIHAICKEVGLEAEFRNVAWDGIFAGVAAGSYDLVASGVTITPERQKAFLFTEPYYNVSQIIVMQNGQSAASFADLKGKTVSVGDAGSGTEFNAAQIFEAYGMTFDDINKQSLGFTDSADKFKDGQLDAFFVTAGAPTTCITDLATSNDFVILSIGETEMQYLKDNYGYYTEYTLAAGTYDKQTEDATTVAVKATLIAADDLSEDVVYNVTKGIFENIEAIKATHAKGAELSADSGVQGVSIPFHAGAEKYFKEIGKLG